MNVDWFVFHFESNLWMKMLYGNKFRFHILVWNVKYYVFIFVSYVLTQYILMVCTDPPCGIDNIFISPYTFSLSKFLTSSFSSLSIDITCIEIVTYIRIFVSTFHVRWLMLIYVLTSRIYFCAHSFFYIFLCNNKVLY